MVEGSVGFGYGNAQKPVHVCNVPGDLPRDLQYRKCPYRDLSGFTRGVDRFEDRVLALAEVKLYLPLKLLYWEDFIHRKTLNPSSSSPDPTTMKQLHQTLGQGRNHQTLALA